MSEAIENLIKEIDQARRDLDDHIDISEVQNNLLIAQAYAYLAIAKANLTSLKLQDKE
jgi:hypothetical protein